MTVTNLSYHNILDLLIYRKVTIAPLVTFRILFGLLMLVSTIRFWANGWIDELYIAPQFYFSFIEGVRPLTGLGMYWVFASMIVAAIFITIGFAYRISAISFFILFTYVELLDKSNYLNHYYFVSLISFLMCWLPANGDFSLDVKFGFRKAIDQIPVAFINILRFQMGALYFFAGLAKMNPSWLFEGQPLKMWLSANAYKPLIGWIFQYKITAYIFSWFGMIYDTTIPFLLSWNSTRLLAYILVIGFHLMTWWLFPIGMFPFIMIVITTIFFSPESHLRVLEPLKQMVGWYSTQEETTTIYQGQKWVFVAFIILQIALPFRYLAYPGDLFWTEQGYRFSWRVMLMEKAGYATFYVSERGEKKRSVIANYEYLMPQQEKMMATQPDMLVQFAHYLEADFKEKGMVDPVVTADVFVTLNGQPNKRYIDPKVDLTEVQNDWGHMSWILSYE